MSTAYLPGVHRGKYMRYDTAVILKRFYLCEKTMVIGQAGWLPGIPYFDMKTLLPKILWEDAMTANALRERVFELRFPSRILEINEDQALIDVIRYSESAPNAAAYLAVLSRVFKPALKKAYETYLELADEIGDGPTYRFMELAIVEKGRQIEAFEKRLGTLWTEMSETERKEAEDWVAHIQELVEGIGGIGLDTPKPASTELKAEKPFAPLEVPARGNQFRNLRFYWPDMVDPSFGYGSGGQLQIRSAVSHFNEVWAVENAGFVLYSFAAQLGWEFVYDAARWVYDESRHCRMGYERLKSWGFEDRELPLGTYIYDSCKGQEPIYRLGMLFYFESKNIGKKLDRVKSFESMNDRMSQHDMDFDWADETIHTSYGKTWLSAILKQRGEDPDDYTEIKAVCEKIVGRTLETATQEEIKEITEIANAMFAKAGVAGQQ